MQSGQYHRVLLPIELASDNKKKSIGAFQLENNYQYLVIHRKGKGQEPETDIGWTEKLVPLLAQDMITTEYAVNCWVREEFCAYVHTGIVRASWEEEPYGHVHVFLGKVSIDTKAYLDMAYPDLFDYTREVRTFTFPEQHVFTPDEIAKMEKTEKIRGKENSHRKFI